MSAKSSVEERATATLCSVEAGAWDCELSPNVHK